MLIVLLVSFTTDSGTAHDPFSVYNVSGSVTLILFVCAVPTPPVVIAPCGQVGVPYIPPPKTSLPPRPCIPPS